jgi:hypothetical protein
MSTEIVTTNEDGEVEEVMSVDGSPATDPMLMQAPATQDMAIQDTATEATDAAEAAWASFQVKANAFLARAIQSTGTFFEQNKQLLSVLGWTLLTLLGIRVVFAALDAIDDIPLVTPVLKLIGLATVLGLSGVTFCEQTIDMSWLKCLTMPKQSFLVTRAKFVW